MTNNSNEFPSWQAIVKVSNVNINKIMNSSCRDKVCSKSQERSHYHRMSLGKRRMSCVIHLQIFNEEDMLPKTCILTTDHMVLPIVIFHFVLYMI